MMISLRNASLDNQAPAFNVPLGGFGAIKSVLASSASLGKAP
jgi:hypothetical protein